MELFENMIQKDFQGGVLVLKNGQVVLNIAKVMLTTAQTRPSHHILQLH